MDSHVPSGTNLFDDATWSRSVQRRKVLEELVATEESYVADMKAFVNVDKPSPAGKAQLTASQVYVTLLASMPSVSPGIRITVERTVTHIVQLHEDLLGELYKAIPRLGRSGTRPSIERPARCSAHMRWRSAESAPHRHNRRNSIRQLRHSFDSAPYGEQRHPYWTADTQIAARVGRVFDTFVCLPELVASNAYLTPLTDASLPDLRSMGSAQRITASRRAHDG